MLRARAVRDIEEQKRCCDACNMIHNGDLLYFAIFENETDCLGACSFRFGPEGAKIIDLKPKKDADYDDEAMYILGKATLNFVDLTGVKSAVFLANDLRMARLLEFYEKDGVMQVNLENYFNEPCARKRKGDETR